MKCKYYGNEKTAEDFRPGRRKCRSCESVNSSVRAQRNLGRPPAEIDGKVCSRCREKKNTDNFYVTKRSDDGWDNYCKVCRRNITNSLRKPEQSRKDNERYRAENPDRIRMYRESYRSDPDSREVERLSSERYNQTPRRKAASRVKSQNRRTKYRDGGLPSNTWLLLLETYGEACMHPSCKTPASALQMDHIVPLSKGGLHIWDNLQILCGDCNLSKGNRSSIDYRPCSS